MRIKSYIVVFLISSILTACSSENARVYDPHVIFSDKYDISLLGGLEQWLHPFDTKKYGEVHDYITKNGILAPNKIHEPKQEVSQSDLLLVHTPEYLESLKQSTVVARVSEVSPLAYMPNWILQWRLLSPMRYATQGTIDAAELALEKGFVANLSGGYHHAKSDRGSGFCYYADIPLAIHKLWQKNPDLKVMIIDLDAHQGNGFEAVLKNDSRVIIFDMYCEDNFPSDSQAKQYITYDVPLSSGTHTEQYLALLKSNLTRMFDACKGNMPDLIIYNAGTDIFEEDTLGQLKVSEQGIIDRDMLVVTIAQKYNIPIEMVLSGGYSPKSSVIISKSLATIIESFQRSTNKLQVQE